MNTTNLSDRQKNPETWYAFWAQFLPEWHNHHSVLFQSQTPIKRNYLTHRIGPGVEYVFCFDKNKHKHFCKSELKIKRDTSALTMELYAYLEQRQVEIEEIFGCSLDWEPVIPEERAFARIYYISQKNGSKKNDWMVGNQGHWQKMNRFMIDTMLQLENALKSPLKKFGV